MASKRRNMFYENKAQETSEIGRNTLEKEPMMTMDVHRRCVDTSPGFEGGGHSPSSGSSSPPQAEPPKPPGKRSFDVAFLMAPDDSAKKRQQRQELKQQLRLVTTASLMPGYSPPPIQELLLRNEKPGAEIPPLGLLMPSVKHLVEEEHKEAEERSQFAKSAFTKVTTGGRAELPPAASSPSSSTVSGGAVSPDNFRDSRISPPPVHRSPPSQYFPPGKPPQYFNGKSPPYLYQSPGLGAPREKLVSSPTQEQPGFHSHYLGKVQEDKSAACKGKIYPGEVLPYGGLAVPYPFAGGFAPGGGSGGGSGQVTLLTAAANVTAAAAAAAALLPPSLAALTLPAQNVCAKCNVSFRMTSDLVYHMRSHHKNDTLSVDSARRRREQDKLRCPVCNESFRERHHLTRHMTAHQDKEGDSVDEEDETPRRRPQAPAK